jgi:hypothetical protein
MNEQQVFLFLTHVYSKEIVKEFKKIKRATRALGPCFILYHQKTDAPIDRKILDLHPYIITESDLLKLSDAPYFADTRVSVKPDRSLIKFYSERKFSYYWLIEYDVRFSGNWKYFFRHFSKTKEDFLTSHIRRYQQEPEWLHWTADHFDKKTELIKALRSFNPIFRISRPALDYIYKMYLDGWTGHYEALFPTLLFHGNFSIRDFGGTGEFVPPQDINQFYLGSTTCALLDGKTIRCYPSHLSLIGYPRNKLIHPVKPRPRTSHWKPLIPYFLKVNKKILKYVRREKRGVLKAAGGNKTSNT